MTYMPENIWGSFFDKNEKKSKKSLNLDFFDPKILAPKVWSKKSRFYDFLPKWAQIVE